MLNINLKIEAKKGYVIDNVFITYQDMPISEEFKLFYQIFEDCFSKQYLKRKESKRMKINFDYKSSLTAKQNNLRFKIFKMDNSLIYIDKKIEYLKKPFPNQNTSNQIKLLESQIERIKKILTLNREKLHNTYFYQ